jgi:hypothetical protein
VLKEQEDRYSHLGYQHAAYGRPHAARTDSQSRP